MIAQAFVRQFAAGQKIDLDMADQEVVLPCALARLNGRAAVRSAGECAAPAGWA